MVQRDYILRMIEQLGVAWAALLQVAGLRRDRQYAQAAALLDGTLRRSLGLDGEALDRLGADELAALVRLGAARADEEEIAAKLLLLAACLRERAELHAAQGDVDAAATYALKALPINLGALLDHDPDDNRGVTAVAPLLRLLAGYALPAALAAQLWRFYEARGDFASAEDWLFRLLEEEPEQRAAGIAFYERLAALPDDALVRGNLPHDEVAAGLAELRARA